MNQANYRHPLAIKLSEIAKKLQRAKLKFEISCVRDELRSRSETIEHLWAAYSTSNTQALLLEEAQRDQQGYLRKLERQLANI